MSPGSEIVPCCSALDSDKITSILSVFFLNLQRDTTNFAVSSSIDDVLAAEWQTGLRLLNGYQNVFHIRFDEEKLIQYPFQANGL